MTIAPGVAASNGRAGPCTSAIVPVRFTSDYLLEHVELVLGRAPDDPGGVDEDVEPAEPGEGGRDAGTVGHVKPDIVLPRSLVRCSEVGDHGLCPG